MTMIVNPGSGPVEQDGEGWTNTYETARQKAIAWLKEMHTQGLRDVELLDGPTDQTDGRWVFTFRHTVTGKTVDFETHGIDDLDAYMRRRIFAPRVYWNGSSSGEPSLEDFEAPGFEPVRTFRAVDAS